MKRCNVYENYGKFLIVAKDYDLKQFGEVLNTNEEVNRDDDFTYEIISPISIFFADKLNDNGFAGWLHQPYQQPMYSPHYPQKNPRAQADSTHYIDLPIH